MDVNWIFSWFLIRRIKQKEEPVLHCFLLGLFIACNSEAKLSRLYFATCGTHDQVPPGVWTTVCNDGLCCIYIFFCEFLFKYIASLKKNFFHYTHCKLSRHEMIASFCKWTVDPQRSNTNIFLNAELLLSEFC